MIRSGVALGLATAIALCVSGCAEGVVAAGHAQRSSAAKNSPTPTFSKFDDYRARAKAAGVGTDQLTEAGEADHVAANLCDNTVQEMEELIRMEATINQGPELLEAYKDKRAMVQASAPTRRSP